jgi:exonuclease SbcC
MISSITLTNFQSHDINFLRLSSGVNVIIGSSDSGKTAILRALNWCVYNRPSGKAHISYWNKDLKDETTVVITKKQGQVLRIRGNDFNGYRIARGDPDDVSVIELEAVGTDVPEEVTKLLNLSEVNIQRQMDRPFLISES